MDESLVLEYQGIITAGTYDERRSERGERPGTYKKHHYVVGAYETGAAPETVAEEISELLDELADADVKDKDVLVAAAYLHAKFENIHPFADGNGRTGRILVNHFLMSRNHPPLIIHDENRLDCYAALDVYHVNLEIRPLQEFFEQQTIKTWEKTLERTMQRKNPERER